MQGGPGHSQPAKGHRCKRVAWSPLAWSTLTHTLKPEAFLLVYWAHSLLPESSLKGYGKLEEENIKGGLGVGGPFDLEFRCAVAEGPGGWMLETQGSYLWGREGGPAEVESHDQGN